MSDSTFAKVTTMNRPKASIRDLIDRSPAGRVAELPEAAEEQEDGFQPPPKKSDPLPQPGDQYQPCARFLSRLGGDERMIQFVDSHFNKDGFSYSDLRRLRWIASDEPGSGPEILLVFVEADITEVRISGRNLDDIHHWISQHAMPWVWEAPKDFRSKDPAATVITRITITQRDK